MPTTAPSTSERTPLLLVPPSSSSSSLSLSPQPLQWSQIYIILLLQLCEPLTSQSIYPYINQLIRDLGVTDGDEKKVGFYAGLVESLFFLTEALTVLHWSRVSDSVGRKPVLLIGLAGLGLSTLAFGMARTFTGIVLSRCICGILNGNIGVMKSVMGELTTPANRAEGFALMPVVWSAGATLGPLIGGGLSKPYDRIPLPFFRTHFWRVHPYFLPCAAVALFVGAAWVVTALFFRETLNRRLPRSSTSPTPSSSSKSPSTSPPSAASAQNGGRGRTPLSSLLTRRRTLVPIVNYTLLALLSISINALQPLFLSTPSVIPPSPSPSPSSFPSTSRPPLPPIAPSYAPPCPRLGIPGLALSPPTIGLILGLFGILNGLFQACFFPRIVAKFGAKGVFRAGVGAAGCVGAAFAVVGLVGGRTVGDCFVDDNLGGGGGVGPFGWIVWALLGVQLALCVLVDMAYGCIFMFITASAPPHALGATNGLAQTAVSAARAVGPVVATSLFSVSLGWRYKYEREHAQGWGGWVRGLLGANMVYVFVVALSCVAVWVGGMLPDTLDESPDESDGEDSACRVGREAVKGEEP